MRRIISPPVGEGLIAEGRGSVHTDSIVGGIIADAAHQDDISVRHFLRALDIFAMDFFCVRHAPFQFDSCLDISVSCFLQNANSRTIFQTYSPRPTDRYLHSKRVPAIHNPDRFL